MELEPNSATNLYKTLTSIILPRPIGWLSTVSSQGDRNIAPFSFFNCININETPALMFSAGRTKTGTQKDTVANIKATEEFVHNVVTEALFEQMYMTSKPLEPEKDEFEYANLTPTSSQSVDPPRVKEAVAHLECVYFDEVSIGDHTMIIGEIQHIHINDSLVDGQTTNIEEYNAVARLFGDYYTTIEPFRLSSKYNSEAKNQKKS